MNGSFAAIESVIADDPGKRGIASLVEPGDLASASSSLLRAKRAVIASGFYIPAAGCCETDGPPGAWALGAALAQLDIPCVHLTDATCQSVFQRAGLEPLCTYPDIDLSRDGVSHLIAVERAGRARDGNYYNMRGVDITSHTAPLDQLFIDAAGQDMATIGIGDGGNEIGMGKVFDRIAGTVVHGETIGSVVATDSLIVAGTSNWGAWGLTAGISLCAGRNLLPSESLAREQLDRFVAAGAVDGVTACCEPTVDSLAWPVYSAVLAALHRLVDAGLATPPSS